MEGPIKGLERGLKHDLGQRGVGVDGLGQIVYSGPHFHGQGGLGDQVSGMWPGDVNPDDPAGFCFRYYLGLAGDFTEDLGLAKGAKKNGVCSDSGISGSGFTFREADRAYFGRGENG